MRLAKIIGFKVSINVIIDLLNITANFKNLTLNHFTSKANSVLIVFQPFM